MVRSYRSARRDDQARATRRAVVDAAAGLFVRDGYAATTLDAVAVAAGVSRRTVVNVAGGKPALLKLAIDVALVGDDEPVPMAQRPMVRRIVACTDPAEAVGLWADMVVEVQGRVALLGAVVEAAADVDPEIGTLRARAERERLTGAREFAAHLDGLGGLRPGLSPDEAADVCWTLNDGMSYRRLVELRGWSTTRYRDWLARVVTTSLLA